MASDRNWETWCANEFLAKMRAQGKLPPKKNEALTRKERTYYQTSQRIFPKSYIDEHMSKAVENNLRKLDKQTLKNYIRRLEESCHHEKQAREEAEKELEKLRTIHT